MPAQTCIYCRDESKGKFPREHVIPEAFGKFKSNFTLHCVCGACNKFFGDFLEPVLSRGAMEGFRRWEHGVKSAEEVWKLDKKRMKLSIATKGDWDGAIVEMHQNAEREGLDPMRLPQVAFRKKDEDTWHWVSEEQLSEEALKPFRTPDLEIKITGPSDDDWKRLMGKLTSLGVRFKASQEFSSPLSQTGEVLIALDGVIDQPVIQCVSKIAFNYVAKMQGCEFVLKPEFDEFRRFARYGEVPKWQAFTIDTTPILADETPTIRHAKGHLMTFDWNSQKDGFLVQVSLFNGFTYRFRLCEKYSGLWFPLRVGHYFDTESHTISRLGAVEREHFVVPRKACRL